MTVNIGPGQTKPPRGRARDLLIIGLAAAIVLADQLSKAWVRRNLLFGVPWDPVPWLRPILSFTYVTNQGAAFGMLPQLRPLYPFIALTVLGVLFFFFHSLAANGWIPTIGLGLLLGGTLGNNIIDRLWHGYVTDFIDLNFWPLRGWPVFNVADSSIVVGVCILTGYLLFLEEPRAATPAPDRLPSAGESAGAADVPSPGAGTPAPPAG